LRSDCSIERCTDRWLVHLSRFVGVERAAASGERLEMNARYRLRAIWRSAMHFVQPTAERIVRMAILIGGAGEIETLRSMTTL